MRYAAHMFIRYLPLVAGVVPVMGVFFAYWLGVQNGLLPACMPPLDGCTSISSTGRYLPGSMYFRAVMLPQAAILSILWWLSAEWLRAMSPLSKAGTRNALLICGIVGALALIIYVSFLGTHQPFYEFMRRFGIYFYFLGTALSQLLLTLSLGRSRTARAMLILCLLPYVLGIANLVQKELVAAPNNFQNRIEWIAALLMQAWFVLLFFVWRRSEIRVSVSVRQP